MNNKKNLEIKIKYRVFLVENPLKNVYYKKIPFHKKDDAFFL